MPDIDDPEILNDAGNAAARASLLDSVLNPPGDSMVDGRFYSPWIERGSDGVPHSVPMPSMQDMRKMTAGQLSAVSERYGYVKSWDAEIDIHKGFLSRFNISESKDKAQFDREMKRLAENNKKAMLGHTRRLAQRHETLTSIGGKLDQKLVYINESAEPCEECEPLGGIEGTYREFAENGTLPGDRCLGNDFCLCTTMAIG